jgi:hypothetical protein
VVESNPQNSVREVSIESDRYTSWLSQFVLPVRWRFVFPGFV